MIADVMAEQEAENPTRRRMVQALWQGRDPFAGFPVTLYQVDPQGWNSGHRYLGEAIAELKPALVVEIGVWKGGSTMTLASGLKALGPEGVVIAVDTWLGSSEHWIQPDWTAHLAIVHGYPQFFYKFMANILAAGLQSHVLPLPLDSLNAARLLELHGSAIDLIHLDAGHDYRSVSGDLEAWWPLLRPGGILIGDDYSRDGAWPEVRQAFDDFFGQRSLDFVDTEAKCLIRKPL
jgi:predicted O-methyltransferase YrrM